MKIKPILAKIRNRKMSFLTFKAALNYYKLPTSNGWSGVEAKLSEETTAKDMQKTLGILEQVYVDSIRFGDKAVQIAAFEDDESQMLQALASHKFHLQFIPAQDFPDPISASELRRMTMSPQVVHVEKSADKRALTFYFYARGYETEKEEFSVEDMTDEISRKRFRGYDHVVAYKQNPYLRVDSVVVLPAENQIQFRVDITHVSSTEQVEKLMVDLKATFREYLATEVDGQWEDAEFKLVNFYPKIDAIYKAPNGTVVKLGHHTASGAINYEKMRGMKGDLRQELYHKAGKKAVATQSFSITGSFPYDNGYSRVHLTIPGKSAQVMAESPSLTTAVISDCFREQQFLDMLNILVQ